VSGIRFDPGGNLMNFIVETAAGQRKRRQRLQIQVAEKGYEVDRQKFT
jgi:hypothetical protein